MWVTQTEFEAGFDAELYSWAQNWISSSWPMSKVVYPGRSLAWDEWDAL